MNYQYRIKHQFDTVMKREKQSITDYFTGTKYTVFFRTKSRSKDTNEQLRLYFTQDTAIDNGTIFTYKNENYVVINKQADESNIYYTSIAQKCTQSVPSKEIAVPFATDNIQATVDKSTALTTIDGTVIMFTGANSYYDAITINNSFNAFGNTYKVMNKYSDNGLGYLKCEQQASTPDTYTLTYSGLTSLGMDDYTTYQLTYTAQKNGITVENPAITYSSGNTEIATVDASGLLTLVSGGDVTITATWTEHDITCETQITVTSVTPVPSNWTMNITGNTNLKVGYQRTYTFVTMNDGVEEYLSGVQYEITNNTYPVVFVTNTFDSSTNKLTLMVDNEDYIDETFTIHAYQTEHSLSATLVVTVKAIF